MLNYGLTHKITSNFTVSLHLFTFSKSGSQVFKIVASKVLCWIKLLKLDQHLKRAQQKKFILFDSLSVYIAMYVHEKSGWINISCYTLFKFKSRKVLYAWYKQLMRCIFSASYFAGRAFRLRAAVPPEAILILVQYRAEWVILHL